MYPASLQKLIEYFLKFPGIGPKQATRFAFFLLKEGEDYRNDLARAIAELGKEVAVCKQCYRSMQRDTNTPMHANGTNMLCEYCKDKKRSTEIIMVVEKEMDMENVEKTRGYNGLYHVLGGTLSPLEASSPKKLHLKELFNRAKTLVETHKNKMEIILATNATAEGDATTLYIQRILEPIKINPHTNLGIGVGIKITRLGRGLTTGSELEYSDPATITNALTNRR